ncbi:hypothetical protein K1X12_07705 [Hyphomonas sp. WL0036]|uniref:hypothetical protein n=1 Tax=Hyphomonas sediminis TaxID=2866160 RepID=UPI001C7F97AB|nr:hypothetical protein [Hyphomonas sediminis]MBY9066781.1 hypothetical protein [Hyphomonas sediminis]
MKQLFLIGAAALVLAACGAAEETAPAAEPTTVEEIVEEAPAATEEAVEAVEETAAEGVDAVEAAAAEGVEAVEEAADEAQAEVAPE